MPSNYSMILSSPTITFRVGSEEREFNLHLGAVSKASYHPNGLMDQAAKLTEDGTVLVLENEEVKTFEKFCEYIYTGDYSARPDNTCLQHHPGWGTTKGPHWNNALDDAESDTSSLDFSEGSACQRCDIITTPLTTHSRVLVFAEKYKVERLADLAWVRLERALRTSTDIRDKDFAELVKVSYQDTAGVDLEPLRDLTIQSLARMIELLHDFPTLQAVVQSTKNITWDLLRATAQLHKMQIAGSWEGTDQPENDDSQTLQPATALSQAYRGRKFPRCGAGRGEDREPSLL